MDERPAGSIPPGTPDSEVLLASSCKGDPDALQALLVRHLPDLRAFVRLRIDPLLRAHESESDLVQSVCLEVLAHPDRFEFRGEAQFRNWLYGAVLHEVAAHRDRHLAKKRRVEAAAPARDDVLADVYTTRFDPAGRAARAEQIARLERSFDELSPEHREVLTLHRLVGLSHAEIADKMGRTPEATRQLLHRAMAQLAAVLGRTA